MISKTQCPFGSKADNIYTVGSELLQMVSELIPDLSVGVVWPHKGVCLFGPTILWDTDYYQKVLFCRPNYNGFKHL